MKIVQSSYFHIQWKAYYLCQCSILAYSVFSSIPFLLLLNFLASIQWCSSIIFHSTFWIVYMLFHYSVSGPDPVLLGHLENPSTHKFMWFFFCSVQSAPLPLIAWNILVRKSWTDKSFIFLIPFFSLFFFSFLSRFSTHLFFSNMQKLMQHKQRSMSKWVVNVIVIDVCLCVFAIHNNNW